MTSQSLLAYHDAIISSHRALSSDAYHEQEMPKAIAARDATEGLIEALSFYIAICGNTCAMVSSETEEEMHAKGMSALAAAGVHA